MSLRDSFPNLRRNEDLSNSRNSLIEQNNVTGLRTSFLRMQFVLHFISPVIFSDFVLTFIHLSQLSRNNIF